MNERIRRNVRLEATVGNHSLLDIYIVVSGSRQYLMSHRMDERLFSLLKNGVSMNELERRTRKALSDIAKTGNRYSKGKTDPRLKCRKNQSSKLENTVNHLMHVAREYLAEMDEVNYAA